MIRNYFKIAFRSLIKNPAYSFINIFGLMIGIACFLVIALYVFDELTFDGFHRNADYIHRVVEQRTSETGKQVKVAATSYQLSEQASSKIPGIIDKARLTVRGRSLVKSNPTDKGFQEENWIVSTNFLQLFDFKMIDGDRQTALLAHPIASNDGCHSLPSSRPIVKPSSIVSVSTVPLSIHQSAPATWLGYCSMAA